MRRSNTYGPHRADWLRCLALAALLPSVEARAQQSDELEPETVVVIGVTPTDEQGQPVGQIPAHVQRATSEDLERQLTTDIAQFLNANFGSVFLNEAQSNPLQPDVQFRGFVASPLLGLPQGLSVYQEGVRINEPFGDTVNWALIPEQAIAELRLVPGSNPLYGLNTLGGALALTMKDGFSHPGTQIELRGGSFGRLLAQGESAGRIGERLGYYATASYTEETGWRDYSPTRATQVFGDLSWRNASTRLDLNATFIDTDLIGNGASPIQLLAIDREAIFTRPDRTQNRLAMTSLRGTHRLTNEIELTGLAYLRHSEVDTLNGDDSDFEECEEAPGLVCQAGADDAETLVRDAAGAPIRFGDAVDGGTINRGRTDQEGYGATIQLTASLQRGAFRHQLIAGLTFDGSDSDFSASLELGTLDATRLAVGSGIRVGDAFTDLDTRTRSYGAYVTDTVVLTRQVTATVSLRYNLSEVELVDQLGTALDGDHRFERINPAVGLTWQFSPAVQLYGSYGESNRAPSPVELTCADEDDPCRLPNAFLSDPPLEQVVARSIEFGARGRWSVLDWLAGVFHTVNQDDILFISAGALRNQGYFDNVGDTRRRGFELDLRATSKDERLRGYLAYTWLDATFEEAFAVTSPNHPQAIGGEIPVEPGDRIPGTPEHLLKLGATFAPSAALELGAEINLSSNRYLRGDEANLLDPVAGSTVANVWGAYALNEHLTLLARIDNLFDEDYATFGLLGAADEVLGEDFDDPRFLSPGAPRSVWIGFTLACGPGC